MSNRTAGAAAAAAELDDPALDDAAAAAVFELSLLSLLSLLADGAFAACSRFALISCFTFSTAARTSFVRLRTMILPLRALPSKESFQKLRQVEYKAHPILMANCCAMVRPSPEPPNSRVVDVSACVKGWKIASNRCGGIPAAQSRAVRDKQSRS